MTPAIRFLALFVAVSSMLPFPVASAQPEASNDRTLSPYFFVKSDDPTVDRLPLKSSSALVQITGVIADVLVTQVYMNEGKKPLEATYVFPASTRAAVHGMKMTIGERVIEAQIKKREDARRDYEQARDQGRSASLLEQQRPNVFQMSVANIMPGDEITVELKYTELIVPTDRVYEFVYPTVVGPRYDNRQADAAPAGERWVRNPYHRQGEAPSYAFSMDVTLSTGLPIRDLASPSHKVKVSYGGPDLAKVALEPSETSGGNSDFTLRYRLDGDRIQSGLLLSQGAKENFFLLMLQPPKRITTASIPGREYVFIVDVSGSMHGFPLEISKKLLRDLIGNLRPTDRFNVLLFSGGSSVMAEESLPATPENIHQAIQVIDRQKGGGGTELLPALKRALAMKKADGFSRTVIIATDGYVTVEEEVFDLIRKNLGDANMFAFGIGTSVNRHIIEGLAHVGMGEPFVIAKADEAPAQAERFRKMIQTPVLTRVRVGFEGFKAYDVEPVSVPDVLADRPVIVFGKWKGKPSGQITLRGIGGDGTYAETIDAGRVKPSAANTALRYLWARHRIMILSDYNKLRTSGARTDEVTKLGIDYNLLTAYTSFVAVDTEIRNTGDKPTTVTQPLPLPQGVSDYAVGGSMKAYAPMAMAPRYEAAPSEDKALRHQRTAADERQKGVALSLEDVTVSRNLSKDAALKSLREHLQKLEPCFAPERGKVVLRVTFNADGTVKAVQVLSGALRSGAAPQCIMDRLKEVRLPATGDGKEALATFTLSLS